MSELNEADIEEIETLAAVIVAKVLDEVAPKSELVSTSNLALGALACKVAARQLEAHALRERFMTPQSRPKKEGE